METKSFLLRAVAPIRVTIVETGIFEEKSEYEDPDPREVFLPEEINEERNQEEIEVLKEEEKIDLEPLSADESNSTEKRGLLYCNGSLVDSEVIYWKIVPGDITYESPITPHHGEHHDRLYIISDCFFPPSLC